MQQPLPVWLGVGGTPQSFARAGALGLPLMVAIIGGETRRFRPLIDPCLQFRRPLTSILSVYQITEEHRARIAELCRRFHVRRLDLVGSATRGDFDRARSDLDLLVEFGPADGLRALDTYFGLKEELETLFGRPVDLIMPAAVANPYVRANMERDRTTLYAA